MYKNNSYLIVSKKSDGDLGYHVTFKSVDGNISETINIYKESAKSWVTPMTKYGKVVDKKLSLVIDEMKKRIIEYNK